MSSLDTAALHLLRTNEYRTGDCHREAMHLFNGHDIERWLLKVLCGLVASKNVRFARPTVAEIPDDWRQILFQTADFNGGQGLYICRDKGERMEGQRGVVLGELGRAGRLVGVAVSICGYELILAMEPLVAGRFQGRSFAYRPLELHTLGPALGKERDL